MEYKISIDYDDYFANSQVFKASHIEVIGDSIMFYTDKETINLIENKNRVLTRDQLLSSVWNYDFAGDTRIVDVHISHLRDKIEENSRKPVFIKTIRGLGYKFEVPK